MQRIIKIICIAICVGLLSVACSSAKLFDTQDAAKIELRSGSTGDTADITDADIIGQITKNINSLRYKKVESSNDSTGWSYSIKWFDADGNLTGEIMVLGGQAINYNCKFYIVSNGNIGTQVLNDLLNQNIN